ncbi:MAG: hypothetical protein ACI88A_000317 [Paraglaciecola sp.]|jgi:uncharacterized protein YcaQ
MPAATELTLAQARKIILLSQKIHCPMGEGDEAVLAVIEQLGYVQIDSISVVQRAHHHTLWNRLNYYLPDDLQALEARKQVFEYWSHAAAYLPMRDFRFSLPKKQAIASGQKHWHEKDPKLAKTVLQRIAAEGPLQAKDFEHKRAVKNSAWWDWKPAKKALEQLFMEGELMVCKRQGFQKVYDLSERVLPDNVDISTPTITEYHQHLIRQFLRAQGFGTPAEMSYLLRGHKNVIMRECIELLEEGQLIKVRVKQQEYYALPNVIDLLQQNLSRNKVKILSPFDNLLIQRKRLQELFNFNYQIECYVPAEKRQYGYFSLPLLWGQNFAGRMDTKIDRLTSILHIKNLHIESSKKSDFLQALHPALLEFMQFNQARTIQVHKISTDGLDISRAQISAFESNFCE